MSLVIDRSNPVHFPKNRDVFKFDEEVAQIFENMAQRSIPMYAEMHRAHCELFKDHMEMGDCTVLDIGASTGRWFRTMKQVLSVKTLDEIKGLKVHAIENSQPMIDKLQAEFPEVTVHNYEVPSDQPFPLSANVVVMFYLLQFVPPAQKAAVMQWVYDHTAPGGIVLMGQKETNFNPEMERVFQLEYIQFRLANGYSMEEITAKTAALKNAMWCSNEDELAAMALNAGFKDMVPTLRWLDFSTHVMLK